VLLAYVGGPGAQAGLRPGDLLLEVEGSAVNSAQDAIVTIAAHKPGSTLAMKVLRGRKMLDIKATVGERPHQP